VVPESAFIPVEVFERLDVNPDGTSALWHGRGCTLVPVSGRIACHEQSARVPLGTPWLLDLLRLALLEELYRAHREVAGGG
jgi:hypothetical protein